MKIVKGNGDVIECTVEEYKAISTTVLTPTKPKHVRPKMVKAKVHIVGHLLKKDGTPDGRAIKALGKTYKTTYAIRQDGRPDGRSLMFRFIAKQVKEYTAKGMNAIKARKKSMQDYKNKKK